MAIGVFDSGVGGLTVVQQLNERMPNESVIFLGDTARFPYGTKSPDTVIRYARNCSNVLLKFDITLLVVGCNTASAHALAILQEELDIPVIGVVEPGAQAAIQATRSGRIGVIGTTGTIRSGAYQKALNDLDSHLDVYTKACPLLVPLADEGWVSGEVPSKAARHYLAGMLENGIDTLVLGCTHYPLLKEVIAEIAGTDVVLVDSAEETAKLVDEVMGSIGEKATERERAYHQFLVSDDPTSFRKVSNQFLGYEAENVEWMDF
jgi:glutamate racemase